jgi:hypothetical protein
MAQSRNDPKKFCMYGIEEKLGDTRGGFSIFNEGGGRNILAPDCRW